MLTRICGQQGEQPQAQTPLVALNAAAQGVTTTFYAYDLQGNVTTLTDANGAVVGSYAYDAWGNTVAISGARAGENPYRFSTKEQIGGLYHFGYRFYDAGNGRWLNRDPLEENGGSNLYLAMNNNPVDFVDPYGENPLEWALTGKWNPSSTEYDAALNSAGEDVYLHSPIRGLSVSGSLNVGSYGRVGADFGWSIERGVSANANAKVGVSLDEPGDAPRIPSSPGKGRGFFSPIGGSYGVSESGPYGRFTAGHSQAGSLSGNAEGGSISLPLGTSGKIGKVGGGAGINVGIDPKRLGDVLPGYQGWGNPSSDTWELPAPFKKGSVKSGKRRGKKSC